jgi:hypothetical protein
LLQAVPVGRLLQSAGLVAGWHAWQALAGFDVPAATATPPMQQPPPATQVPPHASKPAVQPVPQTPLVQVGAAWGKVGHWTPQPPQWSTSAR